MHRLQKSQGTYLQVLKGGRLLGQQRGRRWSGGGGCRPLSASERTSTSKPYGVTEADAGNSTAQLNTYLFL